MIDGLYRVHFKTQMGVGAGVAHLSNGRIWGGDAGLFYVGSYTLDGDIFTASVKTDRHTQVAGLTSVFGIDKVDISLTGKIANGRLMTEGRAAQAPGVVFNAELERVAD